MNDRKKPPPHPFGRAVIFYRQQKGWKRYALAKKAGRQTSEAKRIEEAKSSPQVETIIWVAEALSVHPCELFVKMMEFMEEDKR